MMHTCFPWGWEVPLTPQLIMQVLDAAYLEKYYKMPGAQGYSMQDLQLESMADPETVPFESRSIDMRVLTGQTSLFYTVLCHAMCMHAAPLVALEGDKPCFGCQK